MVPSLLNLSCRRFRTVWLSDLHLGTPACQAEVLLAFLRETRCEHMYLVGDLVDGLRLTSRWFWKPAHNAVLKELFHLSSRGVEITVIPGNHDAFLRHFLELDVGGIRLAGEAVHQTVSGETLWVVHGDEVDRRLRKPGLALHLGNRLYHAVDFANHHWNAWRGRRRLHRRSLHSLVRKSIPAVARFIDAFETAAAREAARLGFDGVVCGHIHQERIAERAGVKYFNTGDWVDSCTALVEHLDGRMELLRLLPQEAEAHALTAG